GGQSLPFEHSHNGPVKIGLRPERIQPGAGGGGLTVDVSVIEDLGANCLIHGQIGDQEITVSQDSELPAPNGQMAVSFKVADAHLFDPSSGARI
ncbi:MAG: TOBE domain-containing protein, partial [Pseudomonadota bacterium]